MFNSEGSQTVQTVLEGSARSSALAQKLMEVAVGEETDPVCSVTGATMFFGKIMASYMEYKGHDIREMAFALCNKVIDDTLNNGSTDKPPLEPVDYRLTALSLEQMNAITADYMRYGNKESYSQADIQAVLESCQHIIMGNALLQGVVAGTVHILGIAEGGSLDFGVVREEEGEKDGSATN